jgi:hypothetical protein
LLRHADLVAHHLDAVWQCDGHTRRRRRCGTDGRRDVTPCAGPRVRQRGFEEILFTADFTDQACDHYVDSIVVSCKARG